MEKRKKSAIALAAVVAIIAGLLCWKWHSGKEDF